MIREFKALNGDGSILKYFYCSTKEQACQKADFTFGDLSCFVQIKATGRKFATLDEFIKKHKSI